MAIVISSKLMNPLKWCFLVSTSAFLLSYPASVLAAQGLSCQNALVKLSSAALKKVEQGEQLKKEALAFARERHDGEFRKFTNAPYIIHQIRVAQTVKSLTDDPVLIAVAYLHDTLENTNTTQAELKKRFGEHVVNMVVALSSDPSEIHLRL